MMMRWSTQTPMKEPADGTRHDSTAGDRDLHGPPVGIGLSSHSIGPFLLLMSIFGTTMTAFALVGSTGEAFKEGIGVYGMLASSSGIIHSYTTQIQFFRDRLESDFVGVLLFPILVCLIVPYLLIGVMASGTVIQTMTSGAFANEGIFQSDNPAFAGGLPPQIGSAVVCIVVLIYVFFGGMRGTAWANTAVESRFWRA